MIFSKFQLFSEITSTKQIERKTCTSRPTSSSVDLHDSNRKKNYWLTLMCNIAARTSEKILPILLMVLEILSLQI